MPYIITKHEADETTGLPGPPMNRPVAVATLDEAREAVRSILNERGVALGDEPELYDGAAMLRDESGAIGPLPDGATIDVRHVDWIAMRKIAGSLPVRTHSKADVLRIFNEGAIA